MFDNKAEQIEAHSTFKPRGEVILGSQNPRILSREQFNQSPNLLWHGSKSPFIYDPNFDFLENDNDNGTTIGIGFYATDNEHDANLYSLQRQGKNSQIPIVQAFLPYQARMFDFRTIEDKTKNASVPVDMIAEFIDFYYQWMKTHYPHGKPQDSVKAMIYDFDTEYTSAIKKRIAQNEQQDLRRLLSISGKGGNVYGNAAGVFTDFMKNKGFDGIIYIEGGDHKEHKNPASYVFYNPYKIGTYESWKQK